VKYRRRPEGVLRISTRRCQSSHCRACHRLARSGHIDRFRCDLTRPLSLSHCHRAIVEVDSCHRPTTLRHKPAPLHFFRFDYFGKRHKQVVIYVCIIERTFIIKDRTARSPHYCTPSACPSVVLFARLSRLNLMPTAHSPTPRNCRVSWCRRQQCELNFRLLKPGKFRNRIHSDTLLNSHRPDSTRLDRLVASRPRCGVWTRKNCLQIF